MSDRTPTIAVLPISCIVLPCSRSILFCFYSVMLFMFNFFSITLHLFPFHSFPFHSIPLCSVPFFFLFCSVLLHYFLFHFILFRSILFYSITLGFLLCQEWNIFKYILSHIFGPNMSILYTNSIPRVWIFTKCSYSKSQIPILDTVAVYVHWPFRILAHICISICISIV